MNPSKTSSKKKLGPYLLLEKLGQGGMGVVYKAQHLELEHFVALKIIRSHQLKQSDSIERFHREASLAARLQHPNIVRVLDSGELNGLHFIVMEYVEGKPLSELWANLPLQETLQILVKVLHALHYAHQQGILHRDLKPSNIFVSHTGEPKIGDFGLAREISSEAFSPLTQTGEILGTPPYMAPEQVVGEIRLLKPATDIYAMGICLYQFLAGCYPFEGNTVHELFYKITVEDPPPPSMHDKKIHPDLDLLTLKALEKVQGQRYTTAQEFAEALQRFLQGDPPFPKSQSLFIQARRGFKKNRFRFVTVSVLCFSLVIFSVIQQGIAYQQKVKIKKDSLKKAQTYLSPSPFEQSKLAQERRIQDLLLAFPYLKKAYLLFPKDQEVKKQTLAVGKEIIALASARGEYGIARHLVQSLQQEQSFSKDIPQFEAIVHQGKTQQQQEQQKIVQEFDQLVTQLKQYPKDQELQQDALFWMTRNGASLSQKILPLLEESFLYFQKDKHLGRELDTEIFYLTILQIVSHVAHSDYIPFLERALIVFQNTLFDSEKQEKLSSFEFDYGYSLYVAFLKSDPLHSFEQIHSFYQKLSEERHFFRWRLVELRRKALEEKLELQIKSLPKTIEQQAEEKAILKKHENAVSLYTLAIQENPSNSNLYSLRGLSKKEMQNLEGALQDLNTAIQIEPSAKYYSLRGNIFEALKKFENARTDFTEAIRLDPEKSEYYVEVARIYYAQNKMQEAFFFCNQALAKNQQDSIVLALRGSIRSEQNDFSNALIDLNQAIFFNPHNFKFYLNRATMHQNLGHQEESLKDYQQAILLNPQYDLAYYNRGMLLQEKGEYSNALRDLNQAIYFDSTKPFYYQSRGKIYYLLEKYEEALADYDQAIKLDPQSSTLLQEKNALLEQMKQK